MNLRLLIVDDDEVDRASVRRALNATDLLFELVEAEDATTGLRHLRERQFDCILLDYVLPERTGIDVLKALRQEGVQTPVVILTGHGDEALAVELMKAGASDYLSKSGALPERLAQSVTHAVRVSRLQEEARSTASAHTAQLRALAEAAVELNALVSVDAVADRIAERARALMMAKTAVVRLLPALFDSDAARADELRSVIESLRPSMRASGTALGSNETLERLVALGLPAPQHSWLAAPLTDPTSRALGVLHVCDKYSDGFTENDEAILVQLSQMAAVAMENARLFEATKRAATAREDMVAIVSHELRNPLNAILVGAEVLQGGALQGRERAMVDRIRRAAQRMQTLTDDLLDIAQIEAGTLSIEPNFETLASVTDEALDLVLVAATERQLTLQADVPEEFPLVSLDRNRILQVLANLLGNALKFTPPGGSVRVEAATEGNAVRISVSDTGPGIAAEHVPHLFERYWQTRETSRLGAGLGLFIAKGIVEAHGGKIWVDTAPGAGTTFVFTLPHAVDQGRSDAFAGSV